MKDFSDILSPELLECGQDLFEENEGLMEEEDGNLGLDLIKLRRGGLRGGAEE